MARSFLRRKPEVLATPGVEQDRLTSADEGAGAPDLGLQSPFVQDHELIILLRAWAAPATRSVFHLAKDHVRLTQPEILFG